jgi:hypothetical protein
MIVGNGDIGEKGAAAIAAADFVIRFNGCRSYEASPGRSDVVAVCNTGRPAKAMLGSEQWTGHPAVREAEAIWSVRDPEKFAAMRASLAVSHPDLDDFCDDYTNEFKISRAAYAGCSARRSATRCAWPTRSCSSRSRRISPLWRRGEVRRRQGHPRRHGAEPGQRGRRVPSIP